ncbi:serine/threonine-protein kinase [Thalassiella azotivora]
MNPTSGQVLGERYRLTDRIAVGGMGEVWRAQDEVLGREVAVKVLKPEYTGDSKFLERFRNEARHTAALTHPNIAGVFDYGETDSAAYLVMELVPGEPLNDTLDREGVLEPRRAMALLAQAARGLSAAHAAGVVHRDVKPGNLLVTPDGGLKVTDFGIARAGDQVPLTATGQVMGTAQYLAPEQAMGHPAVPASDVYALGCVAYEVLTGERPFPGETPVAIAMAHVNTPPPRLPEHLPAGARALVAACLSKKPEERPADALVFADAADAVAEGRDDDALAMLPATAAAAAGLGTAGAATAVGDPRATAATTVVPGGAVPGRGTDDTRTTAAPVASGAGVSGGAAGSAGDRALRTGAPGGPPRRRLTTPLLALLALLLFVVVGALLADGVFSGDEREPGDAPTPAATTSAPATSAPPTTEDDDADPTSTRTTAPRTVEVVASRYEGRPRGEVVAELSRLGLRVDETTRVSGGAEPGTVLAVDPSGTLQVGELVTVVVAAPPPGQGGGDDDGGGGGDEPAPTPTGGGGGGDDPPGGGGGGDPAPTPTTPAPTGTAGGEPTVTPTAPAGDGAGTRAARALTDRPGSPDDDTKDAP